MFCERDFVGMDTYNFERKNAMAYIFVEKNKIPHKENVFGALVQSALPC